MLVARVKSLVRRIFHRQAVDSDLDEEIRSQLELMADQKIKEGMSPEEARRAARIELGGVEQVKEQVRAVRAGAWFDSFVQDIRFALRMLRKNPGFTAVAVLTLALGIGANTAIFSLVNAVLLNSLPVANPHELVLFSDSPFLGSNSGMMTGAWPTFSSEDYAYFGDHNGSFKELAAYQANRNTLSVLVQGAHQRESARSEMVSGNFFSFFGLHAPAGRLFSADDDQPSAAAVAVLNYNFWTSRFHNDPAAIGQTIEINSTPVTIVGVAPRGFAGVNTRIVPDMWLPLAMQPVVIPGTTYSDQQDEYWLSVMGRLKPGVRMQQAQAVVTAQLRQVLNTYAKSKGALDQEIANSHIELAPGAGGVSYLRSQYARALQILEIVVGIVLLMACANVANMLLARSTVREKEICVRLAIGATRARLIRQLLTESLALAAFGGALGILVARWAAQLLVLLVTGNGAAVEPRIDARVLVFTVAVSLFAGIFFGLVPALRAGRADLNAAIKGSSGKRMRLAFPNAIVVFQVAGCVVLLIGAGLFVRSLQKLADQSLGFDQDHILLTHIDPLGTGYKPEQTPQLYRSLMDRIQAIQGVRYVSIDSSNPLSGSSWTSNFSIEGRSGMTRADIVHKELVGPNYFQTEGIPILVGRDISPDDRSGQPLVTVINEAMARKYFPGENPVGKRFSLGSPFYAKEAMTIIGVAADARYFSLRDSVPPMEFCAAFQVPDADSHNAGFASDLEIRTSGDPRAIAAEIRPAIKEIAPGLQVNGIREMKQEVSNALRQNRGTAQLSSAFGALALLLACTGLYGTLSYRVSRRVQEIGVRMALGAQRSNVIWLVAREGLYLILPGIMIGVLTAIASTRIIASQLFGVGANDAITFAAMSLLLLAVALLACWIPARRATRVDPMVALRHE
jgi:predicted permease